MSEQTGQTTKILQEAVDYAQAGNNCFFLVSNVVMIDRCIAILRTLVPEVQKNRNRCVLPGGGSIHFMRQWSERIVIDEQGQPRVIGRSEKFFIDHSVCAASIRRSE